MKKLLTTLLLTAFMGCLSLSACKVVPKSYVFIFNSKKYEIVKEKKTWTDAAKFAASRGGHLVEIDNAAEEVAMLQAIKKAGVISNYTSVADGGGIAYVWIGATDKNQEGHWIWDGANKGQGINFWNGEGMHGNGKGAIANGHYADWGGASQGRYNEPDNFGGHQDAAAIGLAAWPAGKGNLGRQGEWNDINMNNKLYFIVEYNQ